MTSRHTIQITNDVQYPPKRNTMLATVNTSTINWQFTRNSSKRRTRSSMTSGNTTGIPKDKVQQTRLLHLAKGRKVTRKVICDAIRIHYATTTGYTEAAAEWVKDLMVAGSIVWLLTTVHPHPDIKPGDTTDIQEIGEANFSDLNTHEGLVVGVLTWHTGADTERSGTDWNDLQ